MNYKNARLRDRAGMTLVEILLVIALIALVAGLTIQQLGGLFEGGKEDVAKLWVTSAIKGPLNTYNIHMGTYPTTAQGLQALISAPESATGRWRGPYVETDAGQMPLDPWKRPYQYRFPGTKNPDKYDAYSLGPDGVESADDIGNW